MKRQVWYRVEVILAIVMVFAVVFGAVIWRAVMRVEVYQAEQAELLTGTEELLGNYILT